jgi:hypothetical protein
MASSANSSHVRAIGDGSPVFESDVFGEKVGLMGKIFGCGHEELSRPFSRHGIGFRECLRCGARKRFDTETFTSIGGFYYPPRVASIKQY